MLRRKQRLMVSENRTPVQKANNVWRTQHADHTSLLSWLDDLSPLSVDKRTKHQQSVGKPWFSMSCYTVRWLCPSKYFDFVSMCVFVCLSTLISSIFGKSSHFPFPYFVFFVLRCFPIQMVCFHIISDSSTEAYYGRLIVLNF